MSSSNQFDTTTLLILLLGAIFVIPILLMIGFGGMVGHGGMMDGYRTLSGWWLLVGMVSRLVFLIVLLGGGYLVFKRVIQQQPERQPAMEELRMAYARGDLTDEEFEARREKLDKQNSQRR